MKKPLIGLMPLVDEERASYWMLPEYMKGVGDAGGVAMMLPLTDNEDSIVQIADAMDGFIFTGGPDVAPALYGEEKLPECGALCEGRDAMEKRLLSAALKRNKPVLGICRGLQLMNVALGGSLYQDLPTQHPSEICHSQKAPYDAPCHDVQLLEGSLLHNLLGKETTAVNSRHHQAIKELAPGMKAMAYSPDGLIEAICMPDKDFVWAVQWHPEHSCMVNPDSAKIFKVFVDAARNAGK